MAGPRLQPNSGDSSETRNVITATILIAIVMFAWMWFASPPPGQQPSTQEAPIQDTAEVAQQQKQAPPSPEEEREAQRRQEEQARQQAALGDSSLAGALEGEQRTITVETDLYEAQFSTKGAALTSFTLKEYDQFDQETPVQLIDTSSTGALAMQFTTPASHNVDTRSFYFDPSVQGDTLRVQEEEATLTFEAQVGQGAIRKTYVFKPGKYELDLKIDQENPSAYRTSDGYDLIWDGGVPFTEGDPQNEAQGAGAYARHGGEVVGITLSGEDQQEKSMRGKVSWTAVKSKYFTAVIMPHQQTQGATLRGEGTGAQNSSTMWEHYRTILKMPDPEGQTDLFRLYLGPMDFYHITDYDLDLFEMVDYGWAVFEWIARPISKFVFIPFFEFLGSFIPSYGIVIILMAVSIKMLVYPLTKKSYQSMAKMRELQPRMEAIKEKHGDDPQKQQQEMMKMYKETGVNPLGSCLPMLLQYPVIIALWRFLPQAIEIRQQGFLWAHDLSAPDVILSLPFNIPFYGDYVAGFTLLMGLSMIVQMRIQMTGSGNPQAKIFQYVMPLILFCVFNGLASGLSLYYLTYNVVTAVQQKIINRQIGNDEDDAGANGKGGKQDAEAARKRKKART